MQDIIFQRIVEDNDQNNVEAYLQLLLFSFKK